MAKQKIADIGRCIYCERSGGELTEEHIIPFSLGANLTLGKASCRRCAKITGKVELHIARNIAGMLRTRLNIQSRNAHKRERIPKKLFYGDEARIVNVSPAEFPSVFCYSIFAKPGILENRAREGVYRGSDVPWSSGQDENHKRISDAFMAKYGCTSFEMASLQPTLLMSFIAKVGHAATVALLGIDGFRPLVQRAAIEPNLIMDDLLGGQGGCFMPNPDVLHAIEIRQVEGAAGSLIFARLCWFANLVPGRDPTLTTYAEGAPPPLIAIVGRPIDDRLKGKMGYIAIRPNGEETWGIHAMPPKPDFHVRAPSMKIMGT